MLKDIRLWMVLILLVSVVAACDDDLGRSPDPVPSDSVGNPELQANIEVVKGSDNSAIVIAKITAVNQATSLIVELVGDDRLLFSKDESVESLLLQREQGLFSAAVNIGEKLTEMKVREPLRNEPEYFSTINNVNDNTQFYVSLLRSEDASVFSTRVTLPEPFELSLPQDGQSISRTQAILISWDNVSTNTMELFISGECGSTDKVNKVIAIGTDTGQYLLNSNEFSGEIEFPLVSTCDLNLSVKRLRTGSLSSEFGMGGSASGVQQVTKRIISTP